jgi:hypothetical protein
MRVSPQLYDYDISAFFGRRTWEVREELVRGRYDVIKPALTGLLISNLHDYYWSNRI